MPDLKFEEYLKVGFIQTNLDNDVAWGPKSEISLTMKPVAEQYVWQEIRKGFHKLHNHHKQPDIIVLPELTLPLAYKNGLRELSKSINSVVIAGLDYYIQDKRIYNKAILIVPNKWGENLSSIKTSYYILGKKNPANIEKKAINIYNEKWGTDINFTPDRNIYLIDAGKFGKIGFAICADFYDLERFLAYKGRVQHIIIIAYNKDVNSFFALAEAIARLLMCNVIICNTGKFGDSMVYCPYKQDFKRQVFRHQGAKLFATQVAEIPVRKLVEDQKRCSNNSETLYFKNPPEYYSGDENIGRNGIQSPVDIEIL